MGRTAARRLGADLSFKATPWSLIAAPSSLLVSSASCTSSPTASLPWGTATTSPGGQRPFLITLAITYLLPVLSVVVEKRSLASQINALGTHASQIVTTAWDGDGFAAFAPQLVALTSSLGRLAEQHLTYPVLDYFTPLIGRRPALPRSPSWTRRSPSFATASPRSIGPPLWCSNPPDAASLPI